MKFTLSWLRDHLDTEAPLADLVDALTRIGLEVEHVVDPAQALAGFVVARVVDATPHPNADRLKVCTVDAGTGALVQVVCGAPNARAGMISVFSPPGTFIPGKGITLGSGVIRGVESNGMLCSSMELGLDGAHEGIMELPAEAPVGRPYAAFAGLDDPLIEINLTPNRPDAAGVYGIARDLAAAGLGRLKADAPAAIAGAFACPVGVTLDFSGDDTKLAPAFALRLVRGVRNGASPAWMQARLRAIGLRPINALVDITNYMTFDRGRPLHVFDAAKVKGDFTVRRARDGESVLALDGRTYTLDPSIVVIADRNGVESIAGIMGGEHSGCDADTTDVLIESALWSPTNIAASGRTLGITTDARYRFERGIDPAYTLPGLDEATRLVVDLCGGTASAATVAGAIPTPEHTIDFPWSEVARLTGLTLETSEMAGILEKLGFAMLEQAGNADRVYVRVPTWRPDVEGKADLVEEITRIAGVDSVAATPFLRDDPSIARPVLTRLQTRTRLAKRALAARGLVEAVTWSFVAHDQAAAFGGGLAELALANPIASDLSDMRPSLLPGLAAAAQRNADRGLADVALFEVGQVFRGAADTDQRMAAAGLRRGTAKPDGAGRHWSARASVVDAYDAKADALALLAALGIPQGGLQIVKGGPDWFHPGRVGTLQFGPKGVVGHFGELHPRVLELLGVKGPLAAFELVLDALPVAKAKATKTRSKVDLPDLMAVERDFAFVVDREVAAADLLRAAQAGERQMIAGIDVFDVYEGTGVPAGKKSVGLAVRLQPRERTLTDAEIEAVAGRIVAEVGKRTGASLRG